MALTKVRTAGFDHGQKGNSLVNTGTILPHGSSTAPTGFLSCDGSAVSRTTYADLFAVIGTTGVRVMAQVLLTYRIYELL